jgi:GrpB-like predicted nucleotidyltransferase (UPF0157 family)
VRRLDPIRIVAYDPNWPKLFNEQAKRVGAVLEPFATRPVEHIGSTAVPGLRAKPIIDMFVTLRSYDDGIEIATALRSIGWASAPEPDDDELRRLSFCFPNVEYRTHHLHAIDHESQHWRAWLAFRDALRRDPAAAARYGSLKEQLAHEFADDRDAYRAGKGNFVNIVLQHQSS